MIFFARWAARVAFALTLAAVARAEPGDSARGKTRYQECSGCHSVDENDLGPKHRGVVGRRAGSVEDFNYSPALRRSGIVWDVVLLDRWLQNPSELVPGTKMFFRLTDAQSRADVIAYLETLK